MRFLFTVLFVSVFNCTSVFAYKSIFADATLYNLYAEGVYDVYNFEFAKAETIYSKLKTNYPNHPTVAATRIAILFWKHFPMTEQSDVKAEYVAEIENLIELSDNLLDKDESEMDALYFGLLSRAMLLGFYTDNGQSSKAIPHLRSSYARISAILEKYSNKNDFKFACGLYNYYRESYSDAHPVFKPFMAMLRNGNKAEGLQLLREASKVSPLARAEAFYYEANIYLNFEKNYKETLSVCRNLSETFPGNTFYLANYIRALLLNKQYDVAQQQNLKLKSRINKNKFYAIQYFVFEGVLCEHFEGACKRAQEFYDKSLLVSRFVGDFANQYASYAYFGEARIFKSQGNTSKSKEMLGKAQELSAYDHVTFN